MKCRARSHNYYSWMGTVIVFFLLAATGCTSAPPQISIDSQYAEASPQFLGAGSIFMKIRNDGGKDAIVGASADLPNAIIELHDIVDGKMRKVANISVPSRGMLELKPHGLHIMIFNMPRTMGEGSEILLTLRFEKAGEKRVPVKFKRSGSTSDRRTYTALIV